jgi:hypothetical protein
MFRDMDVKFESKIQKYVTYVQEIKCSRSNTMT